LGHTKHLDKNKKAFLCALRAKKKNQNYIDHILNAAS